MPGVSSASSTRSPEGRAEDNGNMSAPPTILSATLKIESGPRSGKAITLRPGDVRQVGRSMAADLRIPHDTSLASIHFAVECTRVSTHVRDLYGSNGLTVNGKRTKEARIADGDRIVAGDTTFVVQIEVHGGPAPKQPESGAWHGGRPYHSALNDADPLVRREALLAATWTRQPGLLRHLRERAVRPTTEHWTELWLLAVLGEAEDLNRILSAAETVELGFKRLGLIGTFGHPGGVSLLLREMDSDDPLTATAAGDAFARITGKTVASKPRLSTAAPGNAGDGGQADDFLEDVWIPDAESTRAHWEIVRKDYATGSRWCRGLNLTSGISEETLEQLDLESRRDIYLRQRYEGSRGGSPLELVRFLDRRNAPFGETRPRRG